MTQLQVEHDALEQAAHQFGEVAEKIDTGITVGHVAAGVAFGGTFFGCLTCGSMALKYEMEIMPVLVLIRESCELMEKFLLECSEKMRELEDLAVAKLEQANQVLKEAARKNKEELTYFSGQLAEHLNEQQRTIGEAQNRLNDLGASGFNLPSNLPNTDAESAQSLLEKLQEEVR